MRTISRRDALLGVPALAYSLTALPKTASSSSTKSVGAVEISQLKERFAGQLIEPNDAAYDKLRRTDNLAFDHRPLLVARCANDGDAARALDFARTRGLPVAVRGGGHCQAGRSSCDDGVVIDLSMMHEVTVDPSRGIVTCGPGARVWEVNEALEPYGLALALGTCGDVGISGLTLGGGLGYLLGVSGAACDSLIAADVVLADGRRETVTKSTDPELLWALRGAGANFGIVTRFEFKARRQGRVLAGTLTFTGSAARDVLALNNTLSAKLPDELAVITTVALPPKGEPHVSMHVCWSGDPKNGRAAIERLISGVVHPSNASLKETSLSEFIGRGESGSGLTCARYGVTTRPLSEEALNELLEYGSPPPAIYVIFFDPVHGAFTRVRSEATALPRVSSGAGVGFLLAWESPGQTAAVRDWADRRWSRLAPQITGAYVNMLDDEGEGRVRAAYGTNYAKLRRLKSKYDPENTFRSNQNIRPG